MLDALHVRLNLLSEMVLVAGANLIDVELLNNTETGIFAVGIVIVAVELRDFLLGEFGHLIVA